MVVGILGVPYALGGSVPGPERGPDRMRAVGLLERLGEANIDARDLGDVRLPALLDGGVPALRGTDLLAREVQKQARAALASGMLPLVLGGDHTVALGAIAAAVAEHTDLGVLWVDAHPDFNTIESSVTGNPHGMVLALAAGLGPTEALAPLGQIPLVSPSRIVVLGARSIDLSERQLLTQEAVRWFGSEAIIGPHLDETLATALGYLRSQGVDAFHLSVDLDVLDPAGWPGVSTPASGGPSAAQLIELLTTICTQANVVSVDVAELNPLRDRDGRTARAAVDLIDAMVGVIARRSAALHRDTGG